MPELPDLEVFSENLTKLLKGKKIETIEVTQKKNLNVSPALLTKKLHGIEVDSVTRYGKTLHLNFKDGAVLGLHLMLRGELVFAKEHTEVKFAIIALIFSDGSCLTMKDYQKAATPTLDPEKADVPDAMDKSVTSKWLEELFSGKKTTIKNILLDQQKIRGIGNAYGDEILWKAGISPFSIAGKIPAKKIAMLAKAIRSVLTNAQKQIKKTNPDIISGEMREFLQVHNSKKEKSPTGALIKVKSTGGRKTYYTDEQEEFS